MMFLTPGFRLRVPVPVPVPVLPASSLRACWSREISASIAVIRSDVFMGVSLADRKPVHQSEE
jgi:hypothetical protein